MRIGSDWHTPRLINLDQGRNHGWKVWELVHGERVARAYNGGLGAVPPVGFRGKAPGQGAKTPKS